MMTHIAGADSALRRRVPFEAITDRQPLRLPGDARTAVWVIVNVEHWSADGAMPRSLLPPPMGGALLPDIPNWAWHEYGMRVGFWRVMDMLKARQIRASFAVNGSACRVYERACAAARDAGWDFIGHGFVQRPMHTLDDQAQAIDDTISAIRDLTGTPPRGWESPGLTETMETPDLLAAAGIEYVCDWPLDDQPVPLSTASGPLLSLPYPVEINDVVITAVHGHSSEEILRRGRDQFDRLHHEGEDNARIMGISLHPYLSGAPHRIGYVEKLLDHILAHDNVVVWTGSEILDWYRSQTREADEYTASPTAGETG